jgi:hypothetical protein
MSKGSILIDNMLAIDDIKDLYTNYFLALLKSYFYPQSELESLAKSIIQMASPAVIQDYWHRLDSSISYKEFLNSIQDPVVRGISPNQEIIDALRNYIDLRYRYALQQIGSNRDKL